MILTSCTVTTRIIVCAVYLHDSVFELWVRHDGIMIDDGGGWCVLLVMVAV